MPNFLKTEKVKQNEKAEKYFSKNKTNSRKKIPNETKISKLLNKGFKVTKILTESRRRIKEHGGNKRASSSGYQ